VNVTVNTLNSPRQIKTNRRPTPPGVIHPTKPHSVTLRPAATKSALFSPESRIGIHMAVPDETQRAPDGVHIVHDYNEITRDHPENSWWK